jgi:hypothetical protein
MKGRVPFFMQKHFARGTGPSATCMQASDHESYKKAHLVFKVRGPVHFDVFTRVLQVGIVPSYQRGRQSAQKHITSTISTALTST